MGPQMHTVPTHLTREDTVLSLGEFSLSSRQFLLLLIGGSLVSALWNRTAVLSRLVPALPTLVLVVRVSLLALSSAMVLAATFVRIAGRDLLVWVVIVALYLRRPRRFLWRPR